MGFSAFVIVGDENGSVGLATSKSKEVPVAIRKVLKKQKKKVYKINTFNGTVPHRIIGEFKASKLLFVLLLKVRVLLPVVLFELC